MYLHQELGLMGFVFKGLRETGILLWGGNDVERFPMDIPKTVFVFLENGGWRQLIRGMATLAKCPSSNALRMRQVEDPQRLSGSAGSD